MAKRGKSFDLKPLLFVGRELLDENGDYRAFDPIWRKALGIGFIAVAARGGDAESMRELGEQFAMGKNTEENLDLAVFWLRKADMHGDEDAMNCLGKVHAIASGRLFMALDEKTKAGDQKAKQICDESLELFFSQGLLGNDFAGTKSSAIIGYAPSQADLGLNYMIGQGVPKDKKKAVEWWMRAVDQGEYRAMHWLGMTYERGDGVTKDDWKALELFRRSDDEGWDPASQKLMSFAKTYNADAEKGNPSAQFFMGVAYENGYGVERNFATAAELYRKAAEQGHPGAQAYLGYCLLTGQGVEKDAKKAVVWLRKAAEQGNPEGQLNYGRCLFYGEGIEKDQAFAAAWYRLAAKQGELSAIYNLGLCYLQGTGTPVDQAVAMQLFKEAAEQGHPGSIKLLKDLQEESQPPRQR